jgi:hypothetical protein
MREKTENRRSRVTTKIRGSEIETVSLSWRQREGETEKVRESLRER